MPSAQYFPTPPDRFRKELSSSARTDALRWVPLLPLDHTDCDGLYKSGPTECRWGNKFPVLLDILSLLCLIYRTLSHLYIRPPRRENVTF